MEKIGRKNPRISSSFDFREAAAAYANRLRKSWGQVVICEISDEPPVGVILAPWMFTPAPFFMIELAFLLRMQGRKVLLIWDEGNVFLDAAKPREIAILRPLLELLPEWMPVLEISCLTASNRTPPDFLDELLYENAVRHLRGETGAEELLSAQPQWREGMIDQCAKIGEFLESGAVGRLCIPGGVWAGSGLWRTLCEKKNIPFTTYDSGPGQVFVGQNSVAAHFGDIRPSLDQVMQESKDVDACIEKSRRALKIRMEGRDPFALQKVAMGAQSETFDLVVPLNLRFDTAALCRQRLFASVTEWLQELLKWCASKPELTVAVRQHPCERIEAFRGRDSWEETLAPYIQQGSNIRFFSAESDVNSYDLVETAKVVLPFTSRLGIEAAMMGKPVVTSAKCYYDQCGFTIAPETAEKYFHEIQTALDGGNIPDEIARRKAAVAYYLMEYCTALDSCFTPQPADFHRWMGLSPGQLLEKPEVQMICAAASGQNSLTILLHNKQTMEGSHDQ